MHFASISLLGLVVWLGTASAQEVHDGCPKNEIACHDVMNGSQCLAQAVDNNRTPTADALVKCVEHEGTASNLPGATKASVDLWGLVS